MLELWCDFVGRFLFVLFRKRVGERSISFLCGVSCGVCGCAATSVSFVAVSSC